MSVFSFHLPTKILFGRGSLSSVGQETAALGKRVMFVCDPFCVATGLADRVRANLEAAGLTVTLYDKVVPNPTTAVIDAGAEIARTQGCDVVVGLGGGSGMDTAKAVAVAARHEGGIWPYAMGEKEITAATLPVIAITTTSGTGSQCTMFSVITNPRTRQKPGMGSPHILPRVAIVDPELTRTMPPALTAMTAFDVFTHAVEAYTSNAATPFSDMYAQQAIRLLVKHLPAAYRDGANLDARGGMALADTYGGVAINHAVVSLGHVMAHVIGGHYENIAHGDALRSIYREVLRFNAAALPEKHAWIARKLKPGCENIVEAFDAFFEAYPFENRLAAVPLSAKKIDQLAAEVFTYMKGIVDLNPVEATPKDVVAILECATRDCELRNADCGYACR